jgi:hypothetical protein
MRKLTIRVVRAEVSNREKRRADPNVGVKDTAQLGAVQQGVPEVLDFRRQASSLRFAADLVRHAVQLSRLTGGQAAKPKTARRWDLTPLAQQRHRPSV